MRSHSILKAIAYMLFIQNGLTAQTRNPILYSNHITEYIWNHEDQTYVATERFDTISEFVFRNDSVYFKKFNESTWLANKIELDSTYFDENGLVKFFSDEYGQYIILYEDEEKMLWYHNWDQQYDNYYRLTVYDGLNTEKERNVFYTHTSFNIEKASVSGIDETELFKEQEAVSALVEENNGELILINFWQKNKSSSYGPIDILRVVHFPETHEYYETQTLSFKWSYVNDYNSDSGVAECHLTKIMAKDQIEVKLEIKVDEDNLTLFQGTLNENIDLDQFID